MSKYEQELKWLALVLGLASVVTLVQDWQPWPMLFSLPFCLLWIYFAWLHTERQLKYVNIVFTGLYIYGIARYFMVG